MHSDFFFRLCWKTLVLKVRKDLMLSRLHSLDLTSDISGGRRSALQAAKWWRATWSTSPASLVASLSSSAVVRHRGAWSLLRELMHTIPLFALLMAFTLQCHSSAHLERWSVITRLSGSMNRPMPHSHTSVFYSSFI